MLIGKDDGAARFGTSGRGTGAGVRVLVLVFFCVSGKEEELSDDEESDDDPVES